MSRNGLGVYSLPPGSTASTLTTISSGDFNTLIADLAADLNLARPIVAGGTGATSASGARAALGLAIGTNVQAYNAGLQSLSGLTLAANKGLYSTGANTVALYDLTAAGRALMDDADAEAQRTTLGVSGIGGNATLITNWNSVSGGGFYVGVSASNAPSADNTFVGWASQTSSTGLLLLVGRMGGDELYMRRKVSGTWQSWARCDVGAGFGYEQSWQSVTRSANTTYTNNTGKPIQVIISTEQSTTLIQTSTNGGSTWFTIGSGGGDPGEENTITFMVGPGQSYRATGSFSLWREFR